MAPDTEPMTTGEIARTLLRLERGQGELAQRFDRVIDNLVTRREQELRDAAVDARFEAIEERQDHQDSRKPTAISIVGAGLSTLAVLWSIFGPG